MSARAWVGSNKREWERNGKKERKKWAGRRRAFPSVSQSALNAPRMGADTVDSPLSNESASTFLYELLRVTELCLACANPGTSALLFPPSSPGDARRILTTRLKLSRDFPAIKTSRRLGTRRTDIRTARRTEFTIDANTWLLFVLFSFFLFIFSRSATATSGFR